MKTSILSLILLLCIGSYVHAQADADDEGALVIKKEKVDLGELQSKQSLNDKSNKNKSKKVKSKVPTSRKKGDEPNK